MNNKPNGGEAAEKDRERKLAETVLVREVRKELEMLMESSNDDPLKLEVVLPPYSFKIIENNIIGNTRYIHRALGGNVNAVTCRPPDRVILELSRKEAEIILNKKKDESEIQPEDNDPFGSSGSGVNGNGSCLMMSS